MTLGLDHHRGQNILKSLDLKDNNLRRLSLEKKYFVGTTEDLIFGKDERAYSSLFNPADSDVYLFLNVWSVTNFKARGGAGERPFYFELIFDVNNVEDFEVSDNITCTNLIEPVAEPKAEIRYADELNIDIPDFTGTIGFSRQTRDYTTIVNLEDGKYIIPPNKGIGIVCSRTDDGEARVAWGWYEEKIESFS